MFKAQVLTGNDKDTTGGLWYWDFICLHYPQDTVRYLLLCPFHRWHCGSQKLGAVPTVIEERVHWSEWNLNLGPINSEACVLVCSIQEVITNSYDDCNRLETLKEHSQPGSGDMR